MKLLVEGYPYDYIIIKEHFPNLQVYKNRNGEVSFNMVGCAFNKRSSEDGEYIYYLPKVILKYNDERKCYLVLNKYLPEEIIDIENNKAVDYQDWRFLSEFSIWLYQTIKVFSIKNEDSTILRSSSFMNMDGSIDEKYSTFLDVALSFIDFNRENEDFFLYIIKCNHRGMNKIDWHKTVSRMQPVISHDIPVYSDLVNKSKSIDFDEELLVIYYSILNYLNVKYHFNAEINFNYDLIEGNEFQCYMNGYGIIRLNEIHYKYFEDRAVRLWNLCYAFFAYEEKIQASPEDEDYLLVTDFHVVFEKIIDELISDKNALDSFKEQKDGKEIDHIYPYQSLLSQDISDPIYYIADSKYYKESSEIDKNSKAVYKQFTYVRNIIQANLDLFFKQPNNKWSSENPKGWIPYRDKYSEGYNITPNFFISAYIDDFKRYDVVGLKPHTEKDYKPLIHFENRLFDRDTLWLSHFNINFLYVISMYARDNAYEMEAFASSVKEQFKEEISKLVSRYFDFYLLFSEKDSSLFNFKRNYFQDFVGKIFKPYGNKNTLILALSNEKKFQEINLKLLGKAENYFEPIEFHLGESIYEVLQKRRRFRTYHEQSISVVNSKFLNVAEYSGEIPTIGDDGLPELDLSKLTDVTFLVGMYRTDKPQYDWIMGKRGYNDVTPYYNVRADGHGAVKKSNHQVVNAQFLILYPDNDFSNYQVFSLNQRHRHFTKEQMQRMNYPDPTHDYFMYILEEEYSLPKIDIEGIISAQVSYEKGAPIYLKGYQIPLLLF